MKALIVSCVMAGLMGVAAVGGIAARPTAKVQDHEKFSLEEMIPKQFGTWRELPEQNAQVVNPQTKQLLDKLYSQTLVRTYINPAGYRIMMSLAYGDDQRGELATHKPETCYPAQGFTVNSNELSEVATPFGKIAARRLDTNIGRRREPVTYWFTVGKSAVTNKIEQRLVEVKMGLTGQIPDGLLFRISSIDDRVPNAYAEQDKFVADLLQALNPNDRLRISGLRAANPG